MSENKKLGIAKKYSVEIEEIANKLNDLENGRIYELTNVKMDGSLAINAQQLKKMIIKLLNKIENQSPSVEDEFSTFFGGKDE